jgi:uncharacterized protein (DUF1501 family)
MTIQRRDFLKRSAFATAGTMLIPNFLKNFEQQSLASAVQKNTDKILVIVQLSGGNDGLNTVVPFRNDLYYQNRPTLGLKPEKILKINNELGLNPALEALRPLYDNGAMGIINNVGYPNPDRSHFRSMDIWHTASDADKYLKTGWLGRFLDAQCTNKCTPHTALEVDDTLSLALKGSLVNGLAVQNPKRLFDQTQSPFYKALSRTNHEEFDNVSYLYKTLSETVSSAEYIYDKTKIVRSRGVYPIHQLGQRMKQIAELVLSGVDTSVYYLSHGSFDTHTNQANQQERLLRQYAEATAAFVNEMQANGLMDRVLVMTFSEFGRRVKQNASNGTDHGTANNVFVIGKNLRREAQFLAQPDLGDLDNGDLKYKIDFRQIYASVLDNWLGVDSRKILGKSFEPIRFV